MFNVTLFLFLATIVLLPLFVLGTSFSVQFWRMNWPFLPVWTLLFVTLNVFYFTNRQLFMLLEKEDWPALIRYLEGRVIQEGRYSSRLVRLLANSYLVLSDSASVISLENKVGISKPSLLEANALVFGTARILANDISGAVRFFGSRRDTVKAGIRDWVRWYHGFALLLDRQFEEAAGEFSLLARLSGDAVITALSSYFLAKNMAVILPEKDKEFLQIASDGSKRVRKSLPETESWKREVKRLSSEIHAAAIAKYLDETGKWLYDPLNYESPTPP